MKKDLMLKALGKGIVGLSFIIALIFLPAGTFEFFGGWLFIGVLFVPMIIMGTILLIKSPELLNSRLKARESEKAQSTIIKLSGIMFILGFVLAGLDYRFSWLPTPKAVPIIASVIFLIGYILYAEVLRENTYLSRTIEVQKGQKVIDTGLYGIVRHPMYFATIIMFLMIPLILGSLIALIPFIFYPIIIAMRINNEEKVLEKDLNGYKEYKQKVKYRILPLIW